MLVMTLAGTRSLLERRY